MTDTSSKPARTGPLVIYVDDERPNRIVFEQSFTEFNVKAVADGAAALEILETNDAAVLVTDMRMPGMSGEELLRVVKEKYPRTIRIVITAYSDVSPILRAVNEGLVARYIVKPWTRNEVAQVLRWACEAWTFGRDSAALHQRLLETERLATLGSMAGMLVHDLKQPLMSLLINIDYLRELADAAPVLREAIAQHQTLPLDKKHRLDEVVGELDSLTTDLKTSATHLSDLVNSLRDMGRPRDGKASVLTTTNPMPIVRHAMAVCQELAVAVRASIGYDGPGALPPVRMSATELMQVLVNVVANGAQAVAARGSPHGKVSISARPDGEMLELKVRDDGVGMPREVLDRAGTPFFTTRTEGTGLGIAQCQRLVGGAGGRFSIESEVGKGTTVTITIPVADSTAA